MKTYTKEQVRSLMTAMVSNETGDEQQDNFGQIILYTGIFEWNDGTFHDEEEPSKLAEEPDEGPE